MTTQYLQFRNPGVAPKEGFCTFGVSTTRSAGVEGTIGRFGTGSKQALALLLRHNLCPVVFCGTLRLTFSVRPLEVHDGLTGSQYGEVWVRESGKENGKTVNRERSLNFVTQVGEHDWNDLMMALREFTANALDRSLREGDQTTAQVRVVDDTQVRAVEGFTSVCVPLTPEVHRFYTELGRRFLHFSEPQALGTTLLPKRSRSLEGNDQAVVYKQGCFVRTIAERNLPSVYDYNFGEELRLDESRTVDDWQVKRAASFAVQGADAKQLIPLFRSLLAGTDTWESTFDAYYLSSNCSPESNVEWQQAWSVVAGNGYLCGGAVEADIVRRKGQVAIVVTQEGWLKALLAHGIKSGSDLLSRNERDGVKTAKAEKPVLTVVARIWKTLERHDLTGGKPAPSVETFTSLMDAGSQTLGFYRAGEETIYLHHDLVTGDCPLLYKVAIEEIGHYVTQAADGSRDFADWAFRVAAALLLAQ